MEWNLEEITNPSTFEQYDRDNRTVSGEGPPSSLGAGLEYDLWEGQFQFVGEPSSRAATAADRNNRQNGPRLAEQFQMIQEKMDALVDTQSVGEERYARVKQENATLQARILMLEEAAKDAETRAEEKLQAEQRRYRELASRLEREKQLQLENCAIKMQANEMEKNTLRDEIARLREQLEKVRTEKSRLENELTEMGKERDMSREAERQATSRANATLQMLEVAKDELSTALEDQQKHEELVQEIADLRARNKILEESRDELQAALALQAGRELLMMNSSNNTEKGPSLAAELLAGMDQDQADGRIVAEDSGPTSISELKQALKEQQEVNAQLRTYIDGILLNIVENYPQLLEILERKTREQPVVADYN